jgi:capsular exopolysaccharide synthesis family protein
MKVLARFYPYYVSGRSAQQRDVEDQDEYYYSDQGQDKHLRDYWNILVKRMRCVVMIFCGTVGLGLLINFLIPTQYAAKSTLQIEPQNLNITGVGGVAVAEGTREGGASPYDYYQTQFALLKSGPLAARVIKKLDLGSNPSFKERTNILLWVYNWIVGSLVGALDSISRFVKGESLPQRPQGLAYELGVPTPLVIRYLKFLEVAPVRNTRLVDVTFETPDPRLSQALANNHATSFIQMILENRFNLTQEARDFLRKKLAELREAVQKAEGKLNQFRQEHGVIGLEKGENIIVERLVDINKELTKVRAERIQAETLYQMTRNKNSQYLADVLSNTLIMQIKGTLANLETEKGRLLSTYTTEHPRIQELNQQIAEAKKGLNAEINNILRGIESTYSAARGREQALEAEAKKQQDLALGLKEVGVDYAVLNEEVMVNRSLYESVLKRLNETNVGNDLAAANIQIMQPAELPIFPSSPNTKLNLIASMILGLLLAVGGAFFLEYMDATVNTPQEVWAAVSLATLGVVPHLRSLRDRHSASPSSNGTGHGLRRISSWKSAKPASRELVVGRDQLSLIAESYRTIRTALLFSQAERPPQVILLTSPCPDEGKTVTTLNLGITLAQSGKRILVIDGDLRKGRCHQMVNLKNQEGLTNVLTGQASLAQCIQPTAIPSLCLLPCGVFAPNPADLFMSQKMREVVRELRGQFDFIVIDSPPIIAVSDAAVLSTVSDGVVLVFHGQKTTTPSARHALERLDRVGAPILGVVLNGVDMRNPDYVDYRSYYSSHSSSPGGPDWRAAAQDISGGVSKGFIERMAAKLCEITGPTGTYLVYDAIWALGETADNFPKSRLNELAERISREILDETRKTSFLSWIATEAQTAS